MSTPESGSPTDARALVRKLVLAAAEVERRDSEEARAELQLAHNRALADPPATSVLTEIAPMAGVDVEADADLDRLATDVAIALRGHAEGLGAALDEVLSRVGDGP